MFHLKRNPSYYALTPSRTKDEIDSSIELLQPYPIVAADALLEIISTVVISALLLVDKRLSQIVTESRNFVTIRHIVVLLVTSVSGDTNCFTSSSKIFRCEVMFENKHTL
jgi:hypothetical protein